MEVSDINERGLRANCFVPIEVILLNVQLVVDARIVCSGIDQCTIVVVHGSETQLLEVSVVVESVVLDSGAELLLQADLATLFDPDHAGMGVQEVLLRELVQHGIV